jgi:hypothetical protein
MKALREVDESHYESFVRTLEKLHERLMGVSMKALCESYNTLMRVFMKAL